MWRNDAGALPSVLNYESVLTGSFLVVRVQRQPQLTMNRPQNMIRSNTIEMDSMKLFLSGGTRGDWQDKVKRRFPALSFFDPRTLRGLQMKEIADTERGWLDECDALFFYFERDNPSGLGSAFEVGYCVAKGIPVIFVDEKQTSHSEWLGIHCMQVYDDFEEGINALGNLIAVKNR